jgi:hypothetical protein
LEKLVPNPDKQKKQVLPSPARRKTRPTEVCVQEAATNVASESIKVGAAGVMEQKADSRNHHCFYRADRKDVEEMHVVLPLDELIQCMDQNFVCSLIECVTVGTATSLNFIGCGETCPMKARLRNNGIDSNYEDY